MHWTVVRSMRLPGAFEPTPLPTALRQSLVALGFGDAKPLVDEALAAAS